MQLVLASSSPYRRALLERLGLPFQSMAPHFAEIEPSSGLEPEELVAANAIGKARSLAAKLSDALIVGSDQVAVCGGEILSKPGSAERAVAQLLQLAGREHRLLSGLAIVRSPTAIGQKVAPTLAPAPAPSPHARECAPDVGECMRVVENRLRMRPLTADEAAAYVRIEQPLDCAGAYKSEGLGIALFEYIHGDDPTAVIGLPLITLTAMLRDFGIDPLFPAASVPGAAPPYDAR